ncbi:unnamed protein product [Adineta steineri]|uniref:Uncharacterized protein n=1 Tax=Adineta steineri TaxID=433720 RepID=A0A815RQJ1_9BILA|nr:unnamed protein product [Adineta steineri]CAF1478385.1 unnamed protein product [Adineta steineri]CAF1481035.1 unnamed protein product [Adineta steineri]
MNNISPIPMDTFAETPNSEKHNSKPHVHMRRSSAYPGYNNVSSASLIAARIRRQSTRNSIPRHGYNHRLIRYENTYRMEPTHDHKVDIDQVRRLTTDIIQAAISGYKYDVNRAKKFSSSLSERIRNEIRQLSFTRYKTIVQVTIGQKRSQGLLVASRCLWDIQLDRQLTISKQTANAFITVTIFLVYTE